MKIVVTMVVMLAMVACDPPPSGIVESCQKTCAPRPVKSWTWDGWKHASVCECDLESHDK